MGGMKMKIARWSMVLLVLMAAVVWAGCGGGQGGDLEGAIWTLTSNETGGATGEELQDLGIDAVFEGTTVSGFSGCNQYNAEYTVSGDSLEIGPIATTMMACPEEIMEIEQSYFTALERSSSFTVDGDTLTIFDGDGSRLLAYVRAEPPALTGITWTVTGYNNGKQAVVSAIVGTELTATFAEDGTVSGSGGVNTFSGPYTVGPLAISIGPLSATEMSSDQPGVMEQEARYLDALQSAARYRLEGDMLELRREDGALAVTFLIKE
jgi:heat shock protein HslJ